MLFLEADGLEILSELEFGLAFAYGPRVDLLHEISFQNDVILNQVVAEWDLLELGQHPVAFTELFVVVVQKLDLVVMMKQVLLLLWEFLSHSQIER